MAARYLYSIYKDGQEVGHGLTAAEVREFAELPKMQVSKYSAKGHIFRKHYMVKCTGKREPQGECSRRLLWERWMAEEWEAACRPFRLLGWQKK